MSLDYRVLRVLYAASGQKISLLLSISRHRQSTRSHAEIHCSLYQWMVRTCAVFWRTHRKRFCWHWFVWTKSYLQVRYHRESTLRARIRIASYLGAERFRSKFADHRHRNCLLICALEISLAVTGGGTVGLWGSQQKLAFERTVILVILAYIY